MTNYLGVEIKHERVCVLHDEKGRILHVHQHFSARDALKQERVEQAARQAAQNAPFREKHPLPKTLYALHVAATEFDPHKRYRVDTKGEMPGRGKSKKIADFCRQKVQTPLGSEGMKSFSPTRPSATVA